MKDFLTFYLWSYETETIKTQKLPVWKNITMSGNTGNTKNQKAEKKPKAEKIQLSLSASEHIRLSAFSLAFHVQKPSTFGF